MALYDKATQLGVAKFAAVALNAKAGTIMAASKPQHGFHSAKHIVLLFDRRVPPAAACFRAAGHHDGRGRSLGTLIRARPGCRNPQPC
ncbi:MAG TPA: hypothetical protein VHY76_14200 [Acetobacteraceae bacterium]|nr:hypothetical protein [Acetobacteraceae bacterium]